MKKFILSLCIIFIFLLSINSINVLGNNRDINEETVQRAVVSKMFSIINNDLNYINIRDAEINFSDVSKDDWFYKYVNTAYIDKLINLNENEFLPYDVITLEQAQSLFNIMDLNNKIKIDINEENKIKPISYEAWVYYYKKLLENLSEGASIYETFGITEKNVIVLSTKLNDNSLKEFDMITDIGSMTHYGLNMDRYINKEIRILEKNNDVIAILEVISETPNIQAAYIVDEHNNSITVFCGGANKIYKYYGNEKNLKDKIADIQINDEEIVDLYVYKEALNDVIKRVTNEEIEFKNLPNFPIVENLKVYSNFEDTIKHKSINNIIAGFDNVELFVKDGLIYAGVLKNQGLMDTLRVLISNTDFSSIIHDEVKITGTHDFTIRVNNVETTYNAGEVINITDEFFENANRIYIESAVNEGKIIIENIKRLWPNNETPRYRGKFEVAKEENGFTIINEVDLQHYLYSVVPSEMPSSFGVEASMVQAITARSYAYNEFFENVYREYGANTIDSILSQVYNNIPENEVSIEAVDNTKGEFLVYDNEVITANFFSTSPGVTANRGEVWAEPITRQFPGNTSPYLSHKKQFKGKDYGDLTLEDNMREFITDMNLDSYDSGFGWFRWNVEMTVDEISASINANLADRYLADYSLIKTLQPDGKYKSKYVESIGKVKDIKVTKRGEAGNIMEMVIVGEDDTILVKTEYNIRMLIKPLQYINGEKNIVLNLKHGHTLENYFMMPSAFYVIDKNIVDGNLLSVVFNGGGNGHGVGMSQNGVKGMLDNSYSVYEILNNYFYGTEVVTK